MIDKTEIKQKLLDKPYTLRMGAGKLSRWWNTTPDLIKEAKQEIRQQVVRSYKPPKAKSSNMPKILLLDIETAPLKAYVWSRWRQNIYSDQILSNWFILTWSAKWLFEDNIFASKLTSKEALSEDDSRITEELWHYLDEADIVIAHNGNVFDLPRINARLLLHNLLPPSPYRQIDTLKIAQRQFEFPSNKLDDLATFLGIEGKIKTSMELWDRCVRGSDKALAEMERYNKQDVKLLEEVYVTLIPWIKSHPNIGLYLESDKPVCSVCGNKDVTKTDNFYYTQTGKYKVYRCEVCGSFSRERRTSYDKEKRKNLLTTLAR